MRIYSAEESKKYISKVNWAGDVFEYAGQKDYGVHGYNPVPIDLAEDVISDINYPLEWLDIPLFLLPFRLMVYSNGWTGMEYNGRAYPSHVLYGARKEIPTRESIGPLIIHEIGHAVCYNFVDDNYLDFRHTEKFKEYLNLRQPPSFFSDRNHAWDTRPSELFAEDFRYLFGMPYMRTDKFLHYKYIEPPGPEIKEWFISLIPGGEKLKNKPEKIILHHSFTEDNELLEDYNAIKRYHTEVRGWSDIGYHWVLEKVGGRLHWIPGRRESTRGAHTKEQNMNYRSIGICIVGNFDEDIPSEEIYREVARKCNEIRKRYPNIGVEDVEPHRKYATYKSCPGKNFDMEKVKAYMRETSKVIKSDVAPIIKDGRTLVEIRTLIEDICGGVIISYDSKTQTSVSVIGKKKVYIQIGNPEIKIEEA